MIRSGTSPRAGFKSIRRYTLFFEALIGVLGLISLGGTCSTVAYKCSQPRDAHGTDFAVTAPVRDPERAFMPQQLRYVSDLARLSTLSCSTAVYCLNLSLLP